MWQGCGALLSGGFSSFTLDAFIQLQQRRMLNARTPSNVPASFRMGVKRVRGVISTRVARGEAAPPSFLRPQAERQFSLLPHPDLTSLPPLFTLRGDADHL